MKIYSFGMILLRIDEVGMPSDAKIIAVMDDRK
jgi:hypothetical protein